MSHAENILILSKPSLLRRAQLNGVSKGAGIPFGRERSSNPAREFKLIDEPVGEESFVKIMVVMGEYPPEERERRRAAVLKCASAGTEIGFGVIKATFFVRANAQINALAAGPLVAEIAQKAEANGFDAVVPFGTLDAGVELARNLVRIPVIGAGQSVMHLGAQLSNRLGVVAYETTSIPYMRKNFHAWRVSDFVVGIRAIEIPLLDSTQNRAAMRERFLQMSRQLVERDDAEIIVPMGVTMVPVQYPAAEFSQELGVPVLDALATSIQTAEIMVRMGTTHSLKTYPRRETRTTA